MTQRKMKDSGIEWIGEIPEEWEIGKIRYYFTIICGATPKSDELKYWNGNINWITPAEMSESNKIITKSIRKITAAGYQSCGTELIPKNSLILSTRAPIGQVCISGCELCTNQRCKSLKIRTANTNYEYYYYYLTIQSAIFNMLGRGTTFMELSTTDLSDYIIPVPSIGEQQTIADYLDKKCAAIDKAIEAEKQIIEKLKIYKQSVITDAVTKGLDKNAKMKPSGIDWIGEIPEEWEVAKVKQHFTIICGSTPKSDESKYWDGNINWITPAEMGVDNAIITDSVRKITKAGYESCGTTLVPVNSIILFTRAPIGQVCISGRELCTNQGCKSLKVQDEATYYEYYFYYFLAQTGTLNMLGRGTTFMELSTTDLANYAIPVPSVAEQEKIASYLDEKCKAIDNCVDRKTALVEKMKQYKKSLIYECITGKREI